MRTAVTRRSGLLRAGTVGRPHGLDGGLYVSNPNPILLEVGSLVRVADRPARITRRAGDGKRVIVWLEGCADRAGAEALRGEELLAARADAPALDSDEWWAEDLEGCVVRDGARAVGTVTKMLTMPSCEVLQVRRDSGAGELLVPLVADAVRAVDIDRGEIDVDLGFLGEE
ncbi:MAG: ribosome maturation factor RimM [Actinomycetota bacterium]|nr:ribosome maturation factor RimM [Actinomycetota bacterium]